MKSVQKIDLGLTGYDELFMNDAERKENKLPRIYDIPLSEIDDFPDHPFKVKLDEDMDQLVQSIKERGIITPVTLRPKEDGRYEIVSGHRRRKACELAGFDTVKAEVREMTRDEAIILMVESNLQRSMILPSEKAFSYKMRLEAMNRQGQRTDLTCGPVGHKLDGVKSRDIIADGANESARQVSRYIRLTELIPELLDLVDEGRIAFRPAVELSYLQKEEQGALLEQISYADATPSPTIRDAEHKRVAVYARVSTKSKEQVSSIENQTKYYTEKIAKTPNWDLAEIYSDEGKSGTSKKWRPEFKRMLEDASKKKMDLIVCASVSRFARNISDLIEEVRKLRTTNPSNPVGVYFETEDLYTLDPNINERLQMQGLFAEWESGNKSRRMILSYDQRICTGQFPLSDLLGLRHTIEGGFIIEEEEAKTVKYIFLATLCGYTAEEIAEVLTDKQRPTLRGRTEWTPSMVKAIMENERRWGDLEVRKRVVIDYKEKVTAKNDGLREGAYIPHYHEGIVSPEIARAAHMMRASRYKFGSVPDVYVIDSGALKGFVSISPTWSGIDNRAFQDISRQVYNEDEFCELQRRANIMNGRTHSNVVSMTLNDYRVAPGVMFMTRSDPQLTFSQRSMKLNAVCWEKLGQQKYVEFLYHPVLEVIAVRSCNATNPNAVLWDETKKSGLQLCTSAFSNAVYDKLDWMRKYKFRFRGVTRVRGGERIIFFFLDEPQILVGKDKKNLDAMDTSDSTVKYIPYKESECGEAAGLTAGIAYPENWQEQVGVSYEIKQQRGRVLDAVSSADIRNHGTKVVNPFIGVIPTHGELEDELEQIYEAM